MAMTKKAVSNFASFRGTPSSNTTWDKLDAGFDARHWKIIVTAGSLEFSLDGKDVFGKLGTGQFDFREANLSRLHVRDTSAVDVEIYAYGVH